MGKSTIVIINQLNIKNNSTKIILKKKHVGKHCRKTKIMRGNIVTFQYFKEKNYEAKLTKII